MDNHEACQSPLADRFAWFRTPPETAWAGAGQAVSADFRHFRRLARLMLLVRHRGFALLRRQTMAKFEAMAFTFGFVLTGLLTFVALPLA